jgi:hypothetical protein
MGEVFSRAVGFRSVTEMLPAVAFHVVFCVAGMSCLVQARRRRQAVSVSRAVGV